MINWIKKRLIHFRTDGRAITTDFVASRQKKAAALRRAVHICFYTQCALAALCAMISLAAGALPLFAIIASLAVIGVAFFALGGGFAERTASYILDLVYAVICFIIGGAFTAIGVFMLMAAVAALISFVAWYFRQYLLEFSPLNITEEDYTIVRYALLELEHKMEEQTDEEPAPPPPPKKSEMLLLAESLQSVMKHES